MFLARFPFVYTKGSWYLGKSQTLLWNGDDKLKKDKIITIRVSERKVENFHNIVFEIFKNFLK